MPFTPPTNWLLEMVGPLPTQFDPKAGPARLKLSSGPPTPAVGVAVGVGVSVAVAVLMGVLVDVGVGVLVAVGVGVAVAVLLGVLVAVGVCVAVAVLSGVLVVVGVGVLVAVLIGVGVCVGVGVGTTAPKLPPSKSSRMTAVLLVAKPICPLRVASNPALAEDRVVDTTNVPL